MSASQLCDSANTAQAALFSAVVGTFVVDSYKALQPDPTTKAIQSLATIFAPGSPTIIADQFQPAAADRIQNGLWFASSVISITTAFLCILTKQWLAEWHNPRSADSARHWAQIHQFRRRGIEAWHVPTLIVLLPLALHLAVFLFFSGLILFLWNLDMSVAAVSLVIVLLLGAFYVFTVLAPLVYASCPYKTPLLPHISKWTDFIARKYSIAQWVCSEETVIENLAGRLSGDALAWLGMSQSSEIYLSVVRAIGAAFERYVDTPDLASILSLDDNKATDWNFYIAELFQTFVRSSYQTRDRIMRYCCHHDTGPWSSLTLYHLRAQSALVRSGHCTAEE